MEQSCRGVCADCQGTLLDTQIEDLRAALALADNDSFLEAEYAGELLAPGALWPSLESLWFDTTERFAALFS
jgi:hypothetical protein